MWLTDPNPKPSPAWLGGWVRWRHATTKKHVFCTFFHVQPKHQNGNIFVDIEGFRPCLSKQSYRAPKWALMGPLMQMQRLKSPPKSPIFENQAIWVVLAIWAQTAILVILASHFQTRMDAPKKKSHLESGLNQRDRATCGFGPNETHRKLGKIFYCRGFPGDRANTQIPI